MRATLTFLILLFVLISAACRSAPKTVRTTAPLKPADESALAEIRIEALQDAAHAIASGKLYVCAAGTFAIYLPGVEEADYHRIKALPKRILPSGCTEPRAGRSIA